MGINPVVDSRLGCTGVLDPIIDDVLVSKTTETEVEEIIFGLGTV
jgi:hypothetical protein